jgi:hypothetical protein
LQPSRERPAEDDDSDPKNRVWRNASQRSAAPRLEISIRAADGGIESSSLNVGVDAAVPSVRQILFKPPREGREFVSGQLALLQSGAPNGVQGVKYARIDARPIMYGHRLVPACLIAEHVKYRWRSGTSPPT